MNAFQQDAQKIAELTAGAIRASNDDTVKQMDELLKRAERTASSIVDDAEAMTVELRESLERVRKGYAEELAAIATQMRHATEELAARTHAFIQHCAESSAALADHQARLNGGTVPPPGRDELERNIMAEAERLRSIPRRVAETPLQAAADAI